MHSKTESGQRNSTGDLGTYEDTRDHRNPLSEVLGWRSEVGVVGVVAESSGDCFAHLSHDSSLHLFRSTLLIINESNFN